MPSPTDIADLLASLRIAMPVGFDGDAPGLALAVLGIAAWLRWVVLGLRRAFND